MTYRDVLAHRFRTIEGAFRAPAAQPEKILELRGFTPMGAPRQNARTKFGSGQSAARVKRYHAYRDQIGEGVLMGLTAGRVEFPDLTSHLGLVFRFPVPKSWSLKARVAATSFGSYHRQKPDIDNLVKGFLDALLEEDCEVCDVRAVKLWVPEGQEGIDVYRMPQWV